MDSWEARRLLELCILDFMVRRGYHQTGEVFRREIIANQNLVDINCPGGFLIDWWNAFYEAFSSRFPEVALLTAESFDKVTQTVQNVVPNISSVNPHDAPNHMGASISNEMSASPMMSSHHLIGSSPMVASNSPDLMFPNILDLLSSISTKFVVPNLSPQRDLTSSLQLLEISNMDGSAPPVISHQVIHHSVIVPTQKEQICPQADSGIPDDTNKIIPENLTVDQQRIVHVGEIHPTKISGKHTTTQEPLNQLRLKSSNKVGEDGVDNYLSEVDASFYALKKSIVANTLAEWKGISIKEIDSLHATQSKLLSCHFHSQGKLLAAGGHDGKVVVWDLENSNVNVGEGHAHVITDIRFRPNSMVFATSSFDRTVMIWDATKPSKPLKNLVGHAEHVTSTDFHPTKMDLLSSCDSNNDIRLWDVNRGDCKAILRGGSRQVRFQPHLGNLLASCTDNIINIFDVKTNKIQRQILGHVKDIRSICWDMSGNYLASVSEDSARIWSVTDGKCIHELCSGGNKFQSCIFSPGHGQVLVIGSYELLELWNPIFQSSKTWPYRAHDDIISSLADSPERGIIASVSHDQWIKIWK